MKKSYVVTPLVAASLGLAGLAFATFTTNSSPWAKTTVGQAQHPTATAVVLGDLYPGDCNDVSITISNPNSHGVEITGLSNTGFRNSDDSARSESGDGSSRLEDFIYQADKSSALNGIRIGAGDSRTVTVGNAVCLRPSADDARQGKSIEAGYFVAYSLLAGDEAADGGS